jgi:hypothetical protein
MLRQERRRQEVVRHPAAVNRNNGSLGMGAHWAVLLVLIPQLLLLRRRAGTAKKTSRR